MKDDMFDALVVGGGPAGLSAALYLARYDRRTALFDAGQGRSTWHQTNHNYLGFPGGVTARQLRDLGYQQLAEYGQVTARAHKIERLSRVDELFCAQSQKGEWLGRTVILCTGVVDHYPHFEHWDEYVGRSMFWCLACDGYACKGRRIVVAGNTNGSAVEALQLTRFTDRITLLTDSHDLRIEPLYLARLERAGIPVVCDRIERASGADGQLEALYTQDGTRLELDQLFCEHGATPETGLARHLDVALDDDGYILVDDEQKTNVPGVFAAGDATRAFAQQVSTAVHEGGQAASAANCYLYPAELTLP